MADGTSSPRVQAVPRLLVPRAVRIGFFLCFGLLVDSLLAALIVPKGFSLTAFGDALQVGLVAAAAIFAFQNFLNTHSRARIFWFLIFTGCVQWTISNAIWAFYEVWLRRPVPDLPLVDILLFLKVVPFAAALAIVPDREHDAQFRVFGLLDVFILMVFSLYLFAFGVFPFRLIPGGQANYNFYFNLADAIGNQTLVVAAGIALVWARGHWRDLYRFYFYGSACYALASVISNLAIDQGGYYTGSLFDVPLIASLSALLCFTLAGRCTWQPKLCEPEPEVTVASRPKATFLSEHLAMWVALSTPLIGLWFLFSSTSVPEVRNFRLAVTLLTILILTILLSIKQDFLTIGLFESLQHLSENYESIDRFKDHLTQSEKLASLGELVAKAANQIKGCMAAVLEAGSRLASRPGVDSRVQNMAGKIAQYARRTDTLVDNMLHFAQETPLCLAPLQVMPLLETALHLSRIAKLHRIRLELSQEPDLPPVLADSSQLLHVFVELISNAVDALEEVGGGTLQIVLRSTGNQLLVEFADSGPGLKEPQRVFEPFYTTKPVGKGTGLGLSTCYGIIQQHDGEIFCGNRPEGGTIIAIRIPFAEQEQPRPQTVHESSKWIAEGVR
jgi:signal transduction histidine kinase